MSPETIEKLRDVLWFVIVETGYGAPDEELVEEQLGSLIRIIEEGNMNDTLARPISGIENRTPQEVFDIMCDRIRCTKPETTESVQTRVERIVFEDFYGSPVAGSKERLAKALIKEFNL